jgi:hypothetical protein
MDQTLVETLGSLVRMSERTETAPGQALLQLEGRVKGLHVIIEGSTRLQRGYEARAISVIHETAGELTALALVPDIITLRTAVLTSERFITTEVLGDEILALDLFEVTEGGSDLGNARLEEIDLIVTDVSVADELQALNGIVWIQTEGGCGDLTGEIGGFYADFQDPVD